MIEVLTCRFQDILIESELSLGKESSTEFKDEFGGMRRLAERGWLEEQDILKIKEIYSKRSVIFRFGRRKTTFTEKITPPNISNYLTAVEEPIVLVSYAEDFLWEFGADFKMPDQVRKIYDYSGRCADNLQIIQMLKSINGYGNRVVPIFTEHDPVDDLFMSDASRLCSSVIYHTPQVIKSYCNGELNLQHQNKHFIKSDCDFVGLGDLLAVKIIISNETNSGLTENCLDIIQEFIKGVIDEY